ncbi:MAG: hypothetical protein EHM41_00155 [Chloroflexi bacterium]|nr:MAG: hypothetical protein EHM41_00155 [Chloroflexota bacterium]
MDEQRITKAVLAEIKQQLEGLVDTYSDMLNTAFIRNDTDKFEIKFKTVLEADNAAMNVTTEISFKPMPNIKEKLESKVEGGAQTNG